MIIIHQLLYETKQRLDPRTWPWPLRIMSSPYQHDIWHQGNHMTNQYCQVWLPTIPNQRHSILQYDTCIRVHKIQHTDTCLNISKSCPSQFMSAINSALKISKENCVLGSKLEFSPNHISIIQTVILNNHLPDGCRIASPFLIMSLYQRVSIMNRCTSYSR